MRYHSHNLKSVLLAFVLAFFFGPFGMFYAGAGWGFLAILLTFLSMFIGCAISAIVGGGGGWFELADFGPFVLVIGLALGYGMMHLLFLVVSPVVVHYKRQDQLDELDEFEAKQARAANRYRPKRRRYSYT
ncbi:MAG: hypothetical protein F4X56_05590 [Gammaproteobacteria bacterium]|nr:hypothetical protein [Gammaproteobacteria bacterium]MYC25375.1 hypothetical protein [Gammaproteobacteria bacterium]